MFRAMLLLACMSWLSQAALAQQNEQRVALIIGNSAYKESSLKNPANDASDMAQTLRGLGFHVVLRVNANRRQMVESVREFGNHIKRGGVGFFYYAGHGVQSSGRNFLVPVGAQVQGEVDLEFEAVDANMVLAQMDNAGNRVNIMVLDACRDNPFARSFRTSSRGLAQLDGAKGTFLAYATSPGSVAADGEGRNGTYTKYLLASLAQADTKLEEVFKRVRVEVAKETGNKQIPWDSSSVLGEFFFRPPVVGTAALPAAADPTVNDRVFWEEVKNSKNADEVKAYLEQFPKGQFAPLARARLKSIEAAASAPVAVVVPGTSAPAVTTPIAPPSPAAPAIVASLPVAALSVLPETSVPPASTTIAPLSPATPAIVASASTAAPVVQTLGPQRSRYVYVAGTDHTRKRPGSITLEEGKDGKAILNFNVFWIEICNRGGLAATVIRTEATTTISFRRDMVGCVEQRLVIKNDGTGGQIFTQNGVDWVSDREDRGLTPIK